MKISFGWLPSIFNRGRVAPADPAMTGNVYMPLHFVPPDLRLSEQEMVGFSVVWAAIRNIVDPIASSMVNVYAMEGINRKHLPEEELGYLLNVRPNPDQTAQGFKEVLLTETLVTGNGYAEVVRNKAGRLAELWPIPSDAVRVTRDAEGLRYEVNTALEGVKVLRSHEVLHIRGPSVRGFLGDSVVYRAAKAVALAVAQETFASSYYVNNTVMGGTLEVPGTMKKETQDVLKADWKAKFGGKKKAHGVAILEGGAKFVPFEVDADKSQLVASRQFSVEDVSRYFQVPLMRLGVQAAAVGYGTNVAATNTQFTRDTLAPWCNRLCEELGFKAFPERKPWRIVEVDLQWLTLGDALQRAQAHEIEIRTGVKTVNECRAEEGLNSIGSEGDLHLVQTDLVVLDEENLQKPEPPAPFGPPGQPPGGKPDPKEDAEDAPEEEPMDAFRRRVNARTADLKKKGHSAEVIAAHVSTLIDGAIGSFPTFDPTNVRKALASIAAGSTNEQAAFFLRL